ncbi:MAG: ATP-binding cassette domain-containing protein [Leptolyngbyaceae cyanobacterium HOT.MB2.61]|nr:ATP-binding cassette domain-containing protein [Leptolyngbyaceae cyanobacterium HOT.MB2.61]
MSQLRSPPSNQPLPLQSVQGEVQLDDITVAYQGRDSALKHLSLHIPARSTVGIVGATGSGKRTLVKLLLSLKILSD